MISSTSSFIKATALAILLIALCGFFGGRPAAAGSQKIEGVVIAVMPVDNLSAVPAPLLGIRNMIIRRLSENGLKILDEGRLQAFIERYRIRYLGGIEKGTARSLAEETGAGAALIASLEYLNTLLPPKIALSARLVDTESGKILWADGIGLAGNQSPGFLELGVIENNDKLMELAVARLTGSLLGHLSGQPAEADETRFTPQSAYNTHLLHPERTYRVAVLPFLNLTSRKHAGQILALEYVRAFEADLRFMPVEPGRVRQSLLDSRVVMSDGLSLADAGALFSRLDADLILSGRVLDYQDFQGPAGTTLVCFSVLMVERETRQVVWSSRSCRQGDEGVFFFDWGKMYTAHTLARAMVSGSLETIP